MRCFISFLIICAITSTGKVMAVPQSSFYAFGTSEGDDRLPPTALEISQQLNLSESFVFFGTGYNEIYVFNDGGIFFNGSLDPRGPFPTLQFPQSLPVILPFWTDADTECGVGNVYFRQTTSTTILAKATADIKLNLSSSDTFNPSLAVVVTWDTVPLFNCNEGLNYNNTFQLVLATDGRRSFALFLYLDNGIGWSAEFSTVQVGYDAGDGINYYSVPGALSPSIADIDTTSNVGVPGLYVFEVSGNSAEEVMRPASGCQPCRNILALIACKSLQDSQGDLPQSCTVLLDQYN